MVTTPEAVQKYLPPSPQREYVPDENETIYVVIRHGENIYNLKPQRYDGRTLNGKLTEKGHLQAEAAGKELAARFKKVDHVLVSGMIRTEETARGILKSFPGNIPIESDAGLLERHLGTFEGCLFTDPKYDECRKKDIAASNDPKLSFEDKMAFKAHEEWECFGSVAERFSKTLIDNSDRLKGKVVVVVIHSGTLRGLYWKLCMQLGFYVPYNFFKPLNGAYQIISARNHKLNLLETQKINIAQATE